MAVMTEEAATLLLAYAHERVNGLWGVRELEWKSYCNAVQTHESLLKKYGADHASVKSWATRIERRLQAYNVASAKYDTASEFLQKIEYHCPEWD